MPSLHRHVWTFVQFTICMYSNAIEIMFFGGHMSYTLTSLISPSVMSLPLLHSTSLGNGCAQLKSPSLLWHVPPIHYGVWHWKNPSKNQTTHSHASHCHHCCYCSVDFMLFHNITCYTNSLLSHIHVNTTNLLNSKCTLVATSMILERLEYFMNLKVITLCVYFM
jgi:hypothetical protein